MFRRTLFVLTALAGCCHGFTTSTARTSFNSQNTLGRIISRTSPKSLTTSTTSLFAFTGLEQDVITNAIQQIDMDQFQHVLASVSTSLSDAAEAVAEESKQGGGWWSSYLNVFKSALSSIHDVVDQPLRGAGITQTWGVSIAIFTVCARSLLIPLSVQQTKGAEYIKALKPYVAEIKKKFKDNKDMQNKAIGKLYEDANQNPLSGCLLSLAQLPLLLGLYRGIRLLAQDGRLDEPFLWIPSLEGPVTAATDYRGLGWLTENWVQIDGTWTPQLGWETTLAFLIMPVLLVLGQSLTMSVLTPPVDENMEAEERETLEKTQRVLKFLPLMIGFFSLQVPAGLTIYWFTTNLFTLTQSLAVRSYYKANPPQIELPDYWDSLDKIDELSVEDKRKAAQAGLAVGPSFPDLLDEAKFHVVVERGPLRSSNTAWQRAEGAENLVIPSEFQEWVGLVASATTTSPKESSNQTAAEPVPASS